MRLILRAFAIAACIVLAVAGQVLVFVGGMVTGYGLGLADGQQVRKADQAGRGGAY